MCFLSGFLGPEVYGLVSQGKLPFRLRQGLDLLLLLLLLLLLFSSELESLTLGIFMGFSSLFFVPCSFRRPMITVK